MYWAQQLGHIKVRNKQENESIENNLKLSQISIAFYTLIFNLPFLIATLLIEIIYFMLKFSIFNSIYIIIKYLWRQHQHVFLKV